MLRSKPLPKTLSTVSKDKLLLSILSFAAGLLVSRVCIFGQAAPLGGAYVAAAFAASLGPYAAALGALIGSATLLPQAPQALLITGLVACVCAAFRLMNKSTASRKLLLTLLICLVPAEFLMRAPTVSELLMALAEALFALVMYLVFLRTGRIMRGKRKGGKLKEEDMVCLALSVGALLLGAAPIHIGWFWPSAALCVFMMCTSAYLGGMGIGAVVGISCGLLLSLSGTGHALIVGNLGAMGLLGGLMRRFKRPGVVLGVVLANALITLLANGSMEVIISFPDVLLGSLLLLALPRQVCAVLGRSLDARLYRESREMHYLEVLRKAIKLRLDALSELFSRIGRTMDSEQQDGGKLIASQLEGAARAMGLLANKVDLQIRFEKDIEGLVTHRLEVAGFKVREVIVEQTMFGTLSARIALHGCTKRNSCLEYVQRAVSTGCMADMRLFHKSCPGAGAAACSLEFEEREALSVMVGCAQVAKQKGCSGDSIAYGELGAGAYMLCLSDGMGSGKRAHDTSMATVSLMENYLRAGMDRNAIFQSLNQLMQLRASEEMFSTVDLAQVDTVRGKVEFTKVGAAPTYLQHKGVLEEVRAMTLPIGILDQISMNVDTLSVSPGDVIIMMSDGVQEALGDELESVIANSLLSRWKGPQQSARAIVDAAVESDEGDPHDDMSVVVARVARRDQAS